MLNNAADIKNEVLVRTNRSTTDAFISDTILNDWLREAHTWANSYHKWPFTEGKASTTMVSTQTDDLGNIAYNYPEGWKADSIRIMNIGGHRVQKLNFDDFLSFRENSSDSTDRVFSDYGRVYYINPRIDVSGTITVWGQYTPTLDPTDSNATTIFSNNDEEGNDAIVEKMISYLKIREHLVQESLAYEDRAKAKLEDVWTRVKDEQYGYQTKDRSMFSRIDVINGYVEDESYHRDQWY